MYHRDISQAIRFLSIFLLLFLTYQLWLKPTYLTPVQQSLEPTKTAPALPLSNNSQAVRPEHEPWEVPQNRLLDLKKAPNSSLSSIRDELDRGNYTIVEERLKKLPKNMLGKESVRLHVAALWNNLGIQQEKYGGVEISVKALKKAAALDPTNPTILLNLTQAYWGLRDPAMTPKFLGKVIHLAPNDPFPHLALADLMVEKGDVASAAAHLNQARPRAEHDPDLESYLRKLTARVESIDPPVATTTMGIAKSPKTGAPDIVVSFAPPARSRLSPSDMPTVQALPTSMAPAKKPLPRGLPRRLAPQETVHFTVQFDGPPDQETWTRMSAILDYAFEELSQKFGHVPTRPVMVVLHTNQKFVVAAGSPAWADTLFDQTSGSIHLPTQGALQDLALFSRIARHEFVHALLFEHLKGGLTVAPMWLVEGLAIQLAEDPWSDIEESRQEGAALIPLTSLQGQWNHLPKESWPSAYLEASSATQNLVDRYSMYGVRQVMTALQAGKSLDAALQEKLSVSYEQFRLQWERNHKSSS